MTWYQRLSALDAAFLHLEDESAHMHVGAICVFEGPKPPFDELARHIESRLHLVPRYRQKLSFVPFGQGRPVWVDDSSFDLGLHFRKTELQSPGTRADLMQLAGWLFSQRLDRERPLWELWCVEGLEKGRFAIISKTHHCMIDGISGVGLAMALLDATPEVRPAGAGKPWRPRKAPSPSELLVGSVLEQIWDPVEAVRRLIQGDDSALRQAGELAYGAIPMLQVAIKGRAPASSLNRPIGRHRLYDAAEVDLNRIRRLKAAAGATVNDVILTVVTGTLRRLLESRGEDVRASLRALVPVSVRRKGAEGDLGNQVTAVLCPLPVEEPRAALRMKRVMEAMKTLKASHQAAGGVTLTRLGDFVHPLFVMAAARAQSLARLFNVVVTNVPGPQHPLFLLGRKMDACYPQVPLAAMQTIGISILSYNGRITVGFLGDSGVCAEFPGLAAAFPEALLELEGLF